MPTTLRWTVNGILFLACLPVLVLLLESLRTSGSWSLDNYAALMRSPRSWALLINSIVLGVVTASAALALGTSLAVVLAKTDLPLRGPLTLILCWPLALPPYVLANGWFRVLGRDGLFATCLRAIGVPSDTISLVTSNWLFGFPGGILVLATSLLPIVILLVMAGLACVNPALEDAGRLGAPWPRVLWSITLPLVRPALAMAAMLVFVLTMGEYGAAAYLRLPVFPVESFTQIAAFYDAKAATAAWVPMLLIVAAVIASTGPIMSADDLNFRWRAGGRPPIELRSWKTPVFLTVVFATALLVILPIAALCWEGLNSNAIRQAWSRGGDSIGWSAAYATAAATLVTIVGFLLARDPSRRLGFFTLALFALPGPLLAFAAVLTWNRPASQWIYGGPLPLILALATQYLAIGHLGFRAALRQMPPALEQAAQIAGAGWFLRTRSVVLPVVMRTAGAVWMLTFTFAVRDSSLALILSPAGRDPLTARMLTLAANGSSELTAALCLIASGIGSIPLILGMWMLHRLKESR